MRWWVLSLALLVGACGQTRDPGIVKHLDVSLAVAVNGSLDVEERLRVDLPAGTTSFRRRADAWRYDNLSDLTGESDVAGSRVESKGGSDVDVTWTFPPVIGGEYTFVLRYRLSGAVEVSGIRGTVAWQFLNHHNDIPDSRFRLTLPAGAVFLDDPWVLEAGFDVVRLDRGMEATGAVRSGASATPGAAFTIDTMTVEAPRWQLNGSRARDLMPSFISGGLFMLVVGAGVIAMLRLKYPAWNVPPGAAAGDGPPLSADIEAALRQRRYPARAAEAMVEAGLIDVERMQVARDLGRAAIATLAFGVMTWIAAATLFGHLGRWPLAIPAGMLGSAVMFWVWSKRMPILSQRGAEARARVLYSARVRDGQTSA